MHVQITKITTTKTQNFKLQLKTYGWFHVLPNNYRFQNGLVEIEAGIY